MGKSALLIGTALLLLQATNIALCQNSAAPADAPVDSHANLNRNDEVQNHVIGHTAWDDDFFYVALQINKPTLTGKNSDPFSNPLEDDAILVLIQTDDDHQATRRTAKSYVIAVSEAGGAQLYSGVDAAPLFAGLKDLSARLSDINTNEKDEQKRKDRSAALLGSIIKVAVTPKGIPRAGGVNAPGYTVEVAIPWSDIGGKPEPGAKMGFNVVAQSRSAGSPTVQSLSPQVLGAADVNNPSLWDQIIFSSNAAAVNGPIVTSPRVILSSKPAIDGEVSQGEWNSLSTFEFGEREVQAGNAYLNTVASRSPLEFVHRPARPIVAIAPGEGAIDPASADALRLPARQSQHIAQLVFAKYEYDFQGDSRKLAPTQNVLRLDNSSALVHHPVDGAGPWLSYDRSDWHRNMLLEARREGIDVILPVYRGSLQDRQQYSDKGLLVLSGALNSLRAAGLDYPQVGLYLDVGSLLDGLKATPEAGGGVRDAGVQERLYRAIRDFYRGIPAAFRCVIPLSADNGGRAAVPVFLSNAAAISDHYPALPKILRTKFAADFPGFDLVIVGGPGFSGKLSLDGFIAESADTGIAYVDGGWIKIASVSGGRDGEAADAPPKLTRKNGDVYRASWIAAIAKKPDWIFLDSWDDFATGAEIAPAVETGFSTADLTRVFTRMFAGSAKNGVKFVWNDAPAAMMSGLTYNIRFRAQNTGLEGWANTAGPGQNIVGFGYRWRSKSGAVLATGPVAPITDQVFGGAETSQTLAVDARGSSSSGAPLSEGDYTLEIGAVSTDRKGGRGTWIDSAASLTIPVHVAAAAGAVPELAATLIRSDLPTTPETGSVYEVNATLRNDGASPWRVADGARVSLRLYRSSIKPEQEMETVVPSTDATGLLDHDVLPGQEVDIRLILPLVDADGKPLPVWRQDNDWQYIVRWEIAEDKRPPVIGARAVVAAIATADAQTSYGISIDPTPIGISEFDFGPKFTLDLTPKALPGDKRLPVRLELQNNGPQTWKKGAVRVGYHWYYQDGTEFYFENETTPISDDVAPGGHVKDLLTWVTAPPYDGAYWLEWDVKFGDTWASTAATTHPADVMVHSVQVVGGRLAFTDLSKDYNVAGGTFTDNLKAGDFDGKGRTFPGTALPPFPDTPVVAQSLWLPTAKIGPDSPRRISYHWGSKQPPARNFISCIGQRIELGKDSGPCRVLHIVAASSGQNVETSLRLIFQEPSSQSEDLYSISISRWDAPPSNGEEIAFRSELHHDAAGVKSGPVMLFHYTITIRDPRKLVALILPDRPDIKIAAITLEK